MGRKPLVQFEVAEDWIDKLAPKIVKRHIDPDQVEPNYSDYGGYGEPETNWHCVRRLWDIALEEEADAPPLPEPAPEPAPTAPTRFSQDPWSNDHGYSDEPPF